MKLRSVIRICYRILSVLGTIGWALIYYRWSVYRATKAFERQLRSEGLPAELVSGLTRAYADRFKRLPTDVLREFHVDERVEGATNAL